MPFKSKAQRAFMYSQHPEIAKRFEAETPKGKKLPGHVSNTDTEAKKMEKIMKKGRKK